MVGLRPQPAAQGDPNTASVAFPGMAFLFGQAAASAVNGAVGVDIKMVIVIDLPIAACRPVPIRYLASCAITATCVSDSCCGDDTNIQCSSLCVLSGCLNSLHCPSLYIGQADTRKTYKANQFFIYFL